MVAELVDMKLSWRVSRAGWLGRGMAWSGLLLALVFMAPVRSYAASVDETVLDAAAIVQMEQRAMNAQPREQCFLFSELLHSLTEQAGREIAAGEEENAQATLKHADAVMAKMHTVVQADAKRLKNAELLLEHSSRRMTDILHVAGEQSRAAVTSTLQHLNALHGELLAQVFAK